MTDVVDLVSTCCFRDVVNGRWEISGSKLFPTEIPEFFILGRVSDVLLAESAASIVDHPNIVALSGQNEGMSNIWLMEDPLHHIAFQGVNQQYRWLRSIRWFFTQCTRDPPHRQNIPIFSHDLVTVCSQPVLVSKLPHSLECVGSIQLSILSSLFQPLPSVTFELDRRRRSRCASQG